MSATSPNDAARAAPSTGSTFVRPFLALPRKPEEKKVEEREQPAEKLLPQTEAPPPSFPVAPGLTLPPRKRKAEDIERKEPPAKRLREATPPAHDGDADDDVQFISESTPHRLHSNIAIASNTDDDNDVQFVKVIQKPIQQTDMSTDSAPAAEPSITYIACETCRANEQQIRYLEAEKEPMRANPRRHSWWYKDELRRICRKLRVLELTSFGKEYLIGRLLEYLDEHNGHVDGKGSPVPMQSTMEQQNVGSSVAEVESSASETEPIRTTYQVQHTPRKRVRESLTQPQTPAAPAPPVSSAVQTQQVVQQDEGKEAQLSPTRATQVAPPMSRRTPPSQENAKPRPQVQRQNLRTLIPGPSHRVQKQPRGEVSNESSQSYGKPHLHTSIKPHHGVPEAQKVDAMWPGHSTIAQPAMTANPQMQQSDDFDQQKRTVQHHQQHLQAQGQVRQRGMSAVDGGMQQFAPVYQQQRTPQPQPQPQPQVQAQIDWRHQHVQGYQFSGQRATTTSVQDAAIQQFTPISRVDSLFEPQPDLHQQHVQPHQHHGQREMTGQIGCLQPFNDWGQQYTALQPQVQQRSQLIQGPQQYGPMHLPMYDNGMAQFVALNELYDATEHNFQHQPQPVQYYQPNGQSQFMSPGAVTQQYGHPSQQSGFDQFQDVPQQQHMQNDGTLNQDDTLLGYSLPLEPNVELSTLFPELFDTPSWQGDVEP